MYSAIIAPAPNIYTPPQKKSQPQSNPASEYKRLGFGLASYGAVGKELVNRLDSSSRFRTTSTKATSGLKIPRRQTEPACPPAPERWQ